jgi:hypothetical protein
VCTMMQLPAHCGKACGYMYFRCSGGVHQQGVSLLCGCWCSPAEAAGTLDWEDPYGKELNTSGIKAYGRAKLQVSRP